MADTCTNDAVALDGYSPSTGALTSLVSLNLDDVLAGWSTPNPYLETYSPGVTVNCDRAGFSGDFTKLLFAGIPSGLAQTHIGYIDLTNGSVHDLTAPRQGTGFGAALLDEVDPAFLGPGNGIVSFGSDQVVFSNSKGNTWVTSVSNPSQATQVNSSDIFTKSAHPEQYITSRDAGVGSSYNPSFTLQAQQGPDGTGGPPYITSFPPSNSPVAVTCSTGSGGLSSIGWVDDTHLVVIAGDSGVYVATVDPNTLAGVCGPNLLPANGRSPSDFTLTEDRRAVIFWADTSSGSAQYELPLSGASQPTLYTPSGSTLPDGLAIWTK